MGLQTGLMTHKGLFSPSGICLDLCDILIGKAQTFYIIRPTENCLSIYTKALSCFKGKFYLLQVRRELSRIIHGLEMSVNNAERKKKVKSGLQFWALQLLSSQSIFFPSAGSHQERTQRFQEQWNGSARVKSSFNQVMSRRFNLDVTMYD